MQEPVGLSLDDGKRPVVITLIDWGKGQKLVWDVTYVDALTVNVSKTYVTAGAAAELACKIKHDS